MLATAFLVFIVAGLVMTFTTVLGHIDPRARRVRNVAGLVVVLLAPVVLAPLRTEPWFIAVWVFALGFVSFKVFVWLKSRKTRD